MSDSYPEYNSIRDTLVSQYDRVEPGKMMSAEAITYKGKVFAFFGRDKVMCFKLGREFKPDEHGITDYHILSPFKNKKPMVDWFLINDVTQWKHLAAMALERMRDQLD